MDLFLPEKACASSLNFSEMLLLKHLRFIVIVCAMIKAYHIHYYTDNLDKGSLPTPKRMNFWKSSEGGGDLREFWQKTKILRNLFCNSSLIQIVCVMIYMI